MPESIKLATAALLLLLSMAPDTFADTNRNGFAAAQIGPRPAWLVDQMKEGPLKDELQRCVDRERTHKAKDFSIGHRGAPLMYPEHTRESYFAAAQMGAGILECDVTFTKDRELVCRHAQCDLHTTTNILATDLAGTCEVPFVPAAFNDDGSLAVPATAKCCTSAITLAEFKTLEGKMDAADTQATTVEEYLDGTPDFRTDLYSGGERGTLLSHAESIELFKELGVGMTPELKSPDVALPSEDFPDYTQQDYAQQMIDEYKSAGVAPKWVWPQSFNYADVLYWIRNEPDYGRQAVFLDDRYDTAVNDPATVAALKPSMAELAFDGVNILAPPMFMMLAVDGDKIIPSVYAKQAKEAGLDMIGWTTERSGKLEPGGGGFYYETVADVVENDGDILTIIDALAQDVGIIGLFSDWPATTTFYANCKRTAKPRRYSHH